MGTERRDRDPFRFIPDLSNLPIATKACSKGRSAEPRGGDAPRTGPERGERRPLLIATLLGAALLAAGMVLARTLTDTGVDTEAGSRFDAVSEIFVIAQEDSFDGAGGSVSGTNSAADATGISRADGSQAGPSDAIRDEIQQIVVAVNRLSADNDRRQRLTSNAITGLTLGIRAKLEALRESGTQSEAELESAMQRVLAQVGALRSYVKEVEVSVGGIDAASSNAQLATDRAARLRGAINNNRGKTRSQ